MKTIIRDIKDWQQLLQVAEGGDADAQMEVALHYDNGIKAEENVIVSPNAKMAYEWTKRAYENGNLEAAEAYAYHLSNGTNCPKNTGMAIRLYEDAIKAGSSTAAHNLGIEYRDQHKFKKAFSLYKKNDTDFSIGMCYYYGIGVAKNKLKAFRFFKKLLKSDNFLNGYETNEANYMIGKMYLEGEVVKQSITKARHHLLLANEDGDHASAEQILWIIGFTSSAGLRPSVGPADTRA